MFAMTDLPVFSVTKINETVNHKTVFVFKKNLIKKVFALNHIRDSLSAKNVNNNNSKPNDKSLLEEII
jgi:hypothetical protein